jgi:capsular exopolysaccharide synthesis family protein
MGWGSKREARSPKGSGPALVSQSDPKSPACEAFRTLLTNIQFAKVDRPCRTVVVTSATPGEGKTTSAANFAWVAAEGGARVCLIDSDLRRPTLHRLFGLENRRGLTTALVEDLPFAEVAQPSAVDNLAVVTSGPLAPNPAKLVGSQRMRELLEKSAPTFDLIVCDSPPVMSVADGLALSAHCDGVILVVRVGRITHEVLRRTTEQIEGVGGSILGVVLNSVNLRRDGRYYRYYKYYRAAQAYYSGNGKR